MSTKKTITEMELLLIANQLIQEHEGYFEGLRASSVEEKEDVLVFKGDYFLSEQGLPTEKTTTVFNVFKFLAHRLSNEFSLQK